jgi:uridine monophosphate synthetase
MDLRRVISSPSLLAGVAGAYAALLERIDFQRIAAIPLAALPIAAAVSLRLGVPFVYPRMVIKEHGTGNSIEGDFRADDRVVLLDDVISTARSKLEAIEVLAREGLRITDLVVLVDRESGGREEIERHGVRCHAWARISELLELAKARAPQERGDDRLLPRDSQLLPPDIPQEAVR